MAFGERHPQDGPLGRVGLIIPSSNRMTENQVPRYTPEGISYHVMRARITGTHHVGPDEMVAKAVEAAGLLADAKADLIVFHCTGSSMNEGPGFDGRLADAIKNATGIPATTTATCVLKALQHLGLRRIALAAPSDKATNVAKAAFLREAGIEVVRDVALDLPSSDGYIGVTPERWRDILLGLRGPDLEGYFITCTNTRAIEIIPELESLLGKPLVTSNQAVIWYCLKHLGVEQPVERLGRLCGTLAKV